MPILPLATSLVSRIVAGEVIDSLAAVVRELAENSIDAGATRLSLALWPEQGRLVLVDDGCGMAEADLELAAAPHSTSKLSSTTLSEALDQITTLGFRGEALHSIAQVAQLAIQSRPPPQTTAMQRLIPITVSVLRCSLSRSRLVPVLRSIISLPSGRHAWHCCIIPAVS